MVGDEDPESDLTIHDDDRSDDLSTDAVSSRQRRTGDCVWPALPAKVIKSAGRVIQILEYFDDIRRPANMVEISRALGYPHSSTSILLHSLVAMGYLEQDREKWTYHPTDRVRLLGSWINPQLFKGDAIIHLMERIGMVCSDTIMLVLRNGFCAQYVHVVQASTSLRYYVPIGLMRPIAPSVPGLALLSQMENGEIAKLTRRVNSEDFGLSETMKVSEVLGNIERIRREGYICMRSKIIIGASILAMPLPGELVHAPMAIAIGGVSERIEPREAELVALLRRLIQEELQG